MIPTPTPTPTSGTITIGIPTPAPVICTPSPVNVTVGQRAVVQCSSQGYVGPFTLTVADPAIAAVQPANGTFTYFYVTGLAAGSTTLTLNFSSGGTGSVTIDVSASI